MKIKQLKKYRILFWILGVLTILGALLFQLILTVMGGHQDWTFAVAIHTGVILLIPLWTLIILFIVGIVKKLFYNADLTRDIKKIGILLIVASIIMLVFHILYWSPWNWMWMLEISTLTAWMRFISNYSTYLGTSSVFFTGFVMYMSARVIEKKAIKKNNPHK